MPTRFDDDEGRDRKNGVRNGFHQGVKNPSDRWSSYQKLSPRQTVARIEQRQSSTKASNQPTRASSAPPLAPKLVKSPMTVSVMLQSRQAANVFSEIRDIYFADTPTVQQLLGRLVANGHLTEQEAATATAFHRTRRLQRNHYLQTESEKMSTIHIHRR